MKLSTISHLITVEKEEDKKTLIEQYKLLLDSINKLNDVRETANNFWIGINGALIGVIAYVRDSKNVGGDQKLFFLFTIIILGFTLSSFWLSSLISIKKNIDIKNKILIELEKYFPAKVFTLTMERITGEQENWSAIVLKEMFVPLVFVISYIFFAIFLYFSPQIILPY